MARISDTRARVRALAEQYAARGEEPSPTAIRRALGRGSASTVVDELRRWREDTAKPAPPQPPAPSPATHPTAAEVPSALAALLQPLHYAIEALGRRIEEQDQRHAVQTALAYERFAAVQKMAMVAIDEAREQTRFWKQEAERAKLDAETRADTYRDAMRSAQAEARRLTELLDAKSPTAPPVALPQPQIAPLAQGARAIVPTGELPEATAFSRGYDPDGYTNE
jgi:hypothetical protein